MAQQKVELLGLVGLIRVMTKVRKDALPAMGAALYAEAQLAFRNSQRQVPFHLGTLKGSGRVFQPEQTGSTVEVNLGYGGAARKYAMYVHERNLNFRNGKKRYYLKDPVEARREGMDARIAKRINAIIREGQQ